MPMDEQAAEDQRERVQGLFIAHSAQLRGFIIPLVGDPLLADDICQDVFLVVSRKAGDYSEGTNFFAWIKAIARYEVLNFMARQRRQRTALLSNDCLDRLIEDVPAFEHEWEEEQRALTDCLGKASERQREMISLRYGEGLDSRCIGERLAMASASVDVLLSRLRSSLRDCVRRSLGRVSSGVEL